MLSTFGLHFYMTTNKDDFIRNFERLKRMSGMTYEQIAEGINISRSYLHQIKDPESKKRPNTDLIAKMAKLFKVEQSDLLKTVAEVNEGTKNTFHYISPIVENDIPVKTNMRLHTNAVLIAKHELEKYGMAADEEEIDEVASRMCEAAAKMGTNYISAELADWIVGVMRKEKE